jgi:hypothetical protein
MRVTLAAAAGVLAAAGVVGFGGCSRQSGSPDPASSAAPAPDSAAPAQTVASGPAAAPPSAPAGPKLVLDQSQYDFGKMETNGAGWHEFVLANRGDRPLVLSRGKSSCGCCTCVCDARLPEQGRIGPGESGKVTLQWSIKQYTGNFRQSENLATNDPQRPEVTLEVSGRITPTVRVVPTQLVFSRVPAGKPAVGEVYLYAYRSEPLKILGHELSDPAKAGSFKITCQPLAADQVAAEPDAQSGWLLRVEVNSSVAAGPFRQQIVLKTNVPSAPEVEIPLEGTVGSEIAVAGFGWDEQTGVLTLGTVAMAKGTSRKLQVVVRGPHAKDVRLKPVKIVPDLLKVDVGQGKPIGQGAVIQIPLSIRIPPGNRAANHLGSKASDLGQIVFETGHPQQPELRVLVRFAVRPDPGK